MKKLILLLMIMVTTGSTFFSFARIHRVGFTDVPPVEGVDYTNFYAAHQAAANGDTIYVFPGKNLGGSEWPTSYNRPVITKKLIIVSKGNWLDTASTPRGNSGLQAGLSTAYFGADYVVFDRGSEGSVLMGFDANGNSVYINTDSITLKHNYNLGVRFGSKNINTNYTLIEGNYRIWFFVDNDDNIDNTWSNVTIRNNFIYYFQIPLKSYRNGIIENNTWAVDATSPNNGGDLVMSLTHNFNRTNIFLRGGSWLFQNNLMIGYYNSNAASNNTELNITGTENTTFNYNVSIQNSSFNVWPGKGTGNIFIPIAQVANIFEAFPDISTSSADSRYRLKANSPANKANRPGSIADAGMYGGNTPYKLSTIPSIPTIYMINSPQGNNPTGNTLQINISTRSNN